MPVLQLTDVEIYYEVHGEGPPMVLSERDGLRRRGLEDLSSAGVFEGSSGDHSRLSRHGTIRQTVNRLYDENVLRRLGALMDHLEADDAVVVGHSMGGRVAQLLALDHPQKVNKLVLASTGAHYPQTKGLPLKICKEMIEWGYEKYERDHSILVGFTEEFAKQYPERVEHYLKVRMQNLCPVEFYLRHLIARQGHDTSGRLKDIRQPALILVGEDDLNMTSEINHRMSSEILAKRIPNSKLVVLTNERHSYFFANPDAAHRVIRAFIKESPR